MNNESPPFVSNIEQMDITSHLKKENELMRHILAEYDDFWEWYEDEYGETKNEVWDKFENKQKHKLII